MDETYRPADVEKRWQERWESGSAFAARDERDPFYVLEMFPYPSGRLHMGHVRNYSIGDVIARYKRSKGYDVLHPMGWDAFGLPAENAAIEHGSQPAEWTYTNIDRMRGQLKRLGFSYDWDREFATCDPDYYRWEQLVFNRMLERDLAYRKAALLNWCDSCGTVLANEQVIDGECYRCESNVQPREMTQWFLRITAYADELLEELQRMPGWPDAVKIQQVDWIGKSHGAMIRFQVDGGGEPIEVFTTRPDTLYGATFMSIAAEHPRVREFVKGNPDAGKVLAFCERVAAEDTISRTAEDREKEGMFTGAYSINPVTGWKMPIYVANFVLAEYGTGMVMAVPAHDQRDFEFARKYDLPVEVVIQPDGVTLDADAMEQAYVEPGTMVNSGPFDGTFSTDGIRAVTAHLDREGLGEATVNYRLRDWGISRQRYWGAPIPVIHCPTCGAVPVPDDQLPVRLPEDVAIDGKGGSPLERCAEFVDVACPRCGEPARRETDTFDTFVESSWYHARYTSPDCDSAPFDRAAVDRWLPVDQYIGGIEHAVMHLLYARFYNKVLRDLGFLGIDEPYRNLLTQGMVCKETLKVDGIGYVYPEEVVDGTHQSTGQPARVGPSVKMSKSLRNVVDPDALIERYGADTMRLFCLFASPPRKDLDWSEQGVEGAYRFLGRVWRLVHRQRRALMEHGVDGPVADSGPARDMRAQVHRTIRKVTQDIEDRFQFNTAIAAVMELVNGLYRFEADREASLAEQGPDRRALNEGVLAVVRLLAPFVPHVTDELWERCGGEGFLIDQPWVGWDEDAVFEETVTMAVQVSGKPRGTIEVPVDAGEDEVREAALAVPNVQRHLEGKTLIKVIVVPGRLVSLVAR